MHEKMIYSRPFLPIKEVKNEENEGRCRCRTKKRGGGDRRYWQPGLINFVPQKLETFSLSLETERENYGDVTGREERMGFFFCSKPRRLLWGPTYMWVLQNRGSCLRVLASLALIIWCM
jgi:hypothetical protein